jgi:uncharacterized membrane protein YidH (DUF202 family)
MRKLGIIALLTLPGIAFAQAAASLTGLITQIGAWVTLIIPILLGLAILVFFWGLVKFIFSAGDEAAKDTGKNLMIWGMIALFVMVAFWGIIGWVQTSLGLTGTTVSTAAPAVNVVPT